MINYEIIFEEMATTKGQDLNIQLKNACQNIHKNLDVLNINKTIVGEGEKQDTSLRSYTVNDIFYILKYKKDNQLNNTQTAKHFKLSRNTVTKWIKIYGNSVENHNKQNKYKHIKYFWL